MRRSNALACKGISGVKALLAVSILALAVTGLSGCGSSSEEPAATSTSGTQATASSTQAVDYYYEAVFLDNDEVQDLFTSVRGEEAPFENVTKDFHVTTAFMPEQTHPEWYGEAVTVHITAYAVQDVKTDDGDTTANEGFKAEVSCENKDLEAYLSSLDKNFHITGAYKDGAKYTEYVDFSQGEAMDVTLVGTFGCGHSDGTIDLGTEQ